MARLKKELADAERDKEGLSSDLKKLQASLSFSLSLSAASFLQPLTSPLFPFPLRHRPRLLPRFLW